MVDAILLGAGRGERYSQTISSFPKQFQSLNGIPVFIHALRALENLGCIRKFILAVPASFLALAKEQVEEFAPESRVHITTGGVQRQDSSRISLEALENDTDRVLIHDACRPYLSELFLERVYEKIFDKSRAAWVPAVPVIETLKRVSQEEVVETVDRSTLVRVQTPQIFDFDVLRKLFEKAPDLRNFTDDASICEYFGVPVGIFEGDIKNIKLTYEFEMQVLKMILAEPKERKCDAESVTIFTA
jgi:2-C-methyl-D-erythritol 4-phosphate cytidylyltransferase